MKVENVGITHSGFFSPSWMGSRGPEREVRFWSEVLTKFEIEPGSSGEQLPSRKSSLWRSLIVVGWMGSSTEDVQLSSFSCSTPLSSSSSCSSSSSSKPGTRWSLARVPSTTGPTGGRASSSCKLCTRLGRGILSCPLSCPGRVGSVWVDLSSVAGLGLGFKDTELPMWPFALVTMLSDSWLEIFQRLRSTQKSHTGTYNYDTYINWTQPCFRSHL